MSGISALSLRLVHLIKPQRVVYEQIAAKLARLSANYRISFAVHSIVIAAPKSDLPVMAAAIEKAIKKAVPFIGYGQLIENISEPRNLLQTLEQLGQALAAIPSEGLEGETIDLLILHHIRLKATSHYSLSENEKQVLAVRALKGMLGLVFRRPGPERADIELTAVNKRNIWLAFKYYSTLNWPEDWGRPDIIVNADGVGAIKARRVLIHELAELDRLAEIFRAERPQLGVKFPEVLRPFGKQKELKAIIEREIGRESERHALLNMLFDNFPEAHQYALMKEAEYVRALARDSDLHIPIEVIKPEIAGGKFIKSSSLQADWREFFETLELVEANYTASYSSATYLTEPRQLS
mgnify:CR=1 FL=1